MSITSSATTSGDWEVPSHNSSFKDRLCTVSIIRRDGTPIDASSISEEDIIELCVKQGCTHLLGVLRYSAAESVVLFLTTDDLKCATCNITGDTELHDEAIMVKTIAPTEAHMSAYATVWHAKPSKGVEDHTPLPCKLPQVGKHPIASMQS